MHGTVQVSYCHVVPSWKLPVRVAAAALALVLLNFSLTFGNTWPTPTVTWRNELSVELAVLVLILALAHHRGRASRWLLGGIAAVWSLLVAGHYVDVTASALFGRDINLYWDLRYVPDVFALMARVAPTWLVASLGIGAVVAAALVYITTRWAIGRVSTLVARPQPRRVAAGIAVAAVLLFAGLRLTGQAQPAVYGIPVTETYAKQVWLAARAIGGGIALPASPSMESDLEAARGTDVMLVFLESYGAITYDRPAFAEALAESRADLAAAVAETGRQVVSAFVESPTFGGSSWLAHISLMSGIEVREPDTNALLMTARRDTLVTTFSRAGYRTLALMPGLTKRWPEGVFYGFDEIYGGEQLGYKGPPFGWFATPDQFTLARLDTIAPPEPGASRFVFFPTISTHTPFRPTPPYQPDWARVLTDHPYDEDDLQRSLAQEVDWLNMGPAYVDAIAYAHHSLAGYLRAIGDRDVILIVIGDHQPPSLVTGEGAPWDVPVHIIASREAVLDRLRAHGFRSGLGPVRPHLGRMHTLLPVLLEAFGGDTDASPDGALRPAADQVSSSKR